MWQIHSKLRKRQLSEALSQLASALRNTARIVEYDEWTAGAVDRFALEQERERIFAGQHLQEEQGPLLVEIVGLKEVLLWYEVLDMAVGINSSINSDQDAGQTTLLRIKRAAARAESWVRTIEEDLPKCKYVFLSYCTTDIKQAEELVSKLERCQVSV